MQDGEARGGGAQQDRLGFQLVRVGFRRAGGDGQGLPVRGFYPAHREREASVGEALHEVAEHGVDGRYLLSRLVRRLCRLAGKSEGGVLLVPADWREGGRVA